MKRALIVVDVQNDFTHGALRNEDAIAALPTVKKTIEYARKNDFTIVYTQDTHGSNYMDTQEGKNLPIPHCLYCTQGWQLCDEIQPTQPNERKLQKITFGCMDFYDGLRAPDFVVEHVDEIWMCGFCTNICTIANFYILKTTYPEIPITIVSDACAGTTPELHDAALRVMESCQAKVATLEELTKNEGD